MTAIDTSTEPDASCPRGLRGPDDGHAQRRLHRPDDEHRPPDRALRRAARRGRPPVAALAERAQLNERYVREWLGAPDRGPGGRATTRAPGTYTLPAEHAAWVTTAAGPNNLARTMQFIPLLAAGGAGHRRLLPERRWPLLRPLPAVPRADGRGQRGRVVDAALVDAVVPLVDGLPERLRGRHRRRGHRLRQRSRHQRPGARPTPPAGSSGTTSPTDAIGSAQAEAGRLGLTNARFEVAGRGDARPSPVRSTWSPPSTRSTTRPIRRRCSPQPRGRCAPEARS